MSLGKLALHVAMSPGVILRLGARGRDRVRRRIRRPIRSPRTKSWPSTTRACRASRTSCRRCRTRKCPRRGRRDRRAAGPRSSRCRRSALLRGARTEPHLSPPRAVVGVSATARRAGAVDLRAERGRESVAVRTDGGGDSATIAALRTMQGAERCDSDEAGSAVGTSTRQRRRLRRRTS